MNIFLYLGAICCVIGLSVGQILFKLSAKKLALDGNLIQFKVLMILSIAFLIYGVTSIAWVYILQKIDLGKVYPLMALAFIFVPVGSAIFFEESFTTQYMLGVFLIISGIVIAVNS